MKHRLLYPLLLWLTAQRPARIIKISAKPYLIRYYMGQRFGRTFYLHQFLTADGERHIHNHPWRLSRSLVLAGSYFEERLSALCAKNGPKLQMRRVGLTNRIDQADFHRIAAVWPGTWTLFFHTTPRLHQWGFLEIADPDEDGYRATHFHQPLRYDATDWWTHPDCLSGNKAREAGRK